MHVQANDSICENGAIQLEKKKASATTTTHIHFDNDKINSSNSNFVCSLKRFNRFYCRSNEHTNALHREPVLCLEKVKLQNKTIKKNYMKRSNQNGIFFHQTQL